MKARVLVFFAAMLLSGAALAQGITRDELIQMRRQTQTREFSARQNAVSNNPVSRLAASKRGRDGRDNEFTHVIQRPRVTDQARSGRCWLFAGLNVLRFEAARALGVKEFELSESHLFFYHKLELVNYVLSEAMHGRPDPDDPQVAFLLRNGLGDGGYWGMFTSLAAKYGVVPKDVMPETLHTSNTGESNELLDALVKGHVAAIWRMRNDRRPGAEIGARRLAALSDAYRLLALMFGTPPESFRWRYRGADGKLRPYADYTPASFFSAYVRPGLTSKAHLMSDPSLPYYSNFVMPALKNAAESWGETFVNVPPGVALEAARVSVLADEPVWFGADVGKYFDPAGGTLDLGNYDYEALLGVPLRSTRTDMLRTYASAATHAMVLVGVDIDGEGRPVKWLVENSWGPGAGQGGYLTMTSAWFAMYGFDVIVDRRHADETVLAAMATDPKPLPPWHHLWRP